MSGILVPVEGNRLRSLARTAAPANDEDIRFINTMRRATARYARQYHLRHADFQRLMELAERGIVDKHKPVQQVEPDELTDPGNKREQAPIDLLDIPGDLKAKLKSSENGPAFETIEQLANFMYKQDLAEAKNGIGERSVAKIREAINARMEPQQTADESADK